MFYPVFIDLAGKNVLVVGGGAVAERKVAALHEAGANVTVVSPDATARIATSTIRWEKRQFIESDLDGITLVVSATDDPRVQRQVAESARRRKILVNTADKPELCDFIVPAIVRQGDVIAAISTSGKSPALAAALRAQIEKLLSKDVGRAANLLGAIRNEVHERFPDADDRKRVFERILESGLLDWLRECDDEAALARIRKVIDVS